MPPRRNGSTALAERPTSQAALENLEKVVITGDLSQLTPAERIGYYARVTQSLGLNPLTRPFEYITLNNRLVLYARKDASDQLRQVKGISVDRVERERDDTLGLAIVTVYGHDKSGRTDSAIGAVSIAGLKGEAMANALMKAETKGKRRMTLSLAGLGWLDESEIETAQAVVADPVTAQERTEKVASRAEALENAAETQPAGKTTSEQALDIDDIPFDPARSAEEAPAHWMRAIHAAGAERGIDHDRLHNWAVAAFGVGSLNDLDDNQRERLLAAVQSAATSCSHPQRMHKVTPVGVVCVVCGTLLAARIQQPGQDAGEQAPVDTPAPVPQQAHAASDGEPAPSADQPDPGATEVGLGGPSSKTRDPAPAPADAPTPPGGASPATDSLEAATSAVAEIAAKRGLPTWERVDAFALKATGKLADAFSAEDWTVFGAELAAGTYDALLTARPRRPRRQPVVTP